ncbi:hypothetical protein EVAR_52860_1 [Eumeta japonica]|uniref:Uncharacterized protein n=1 Tax=Eumeta variegata TaxID=151549 RepID=A0A4C1YEB3_EUMVA|nr:hypothetical protein EVAR_52860_1 [Eumeta japonica]
MSDSEGFAGLYPTGRVGSFGVRERPTSAKAAPTATRSGRLPHVLLDIDFIMTQLTPLTNYDRTTTKENRVHRSDVSSIESATPIGDNQSSSLHTRRAGLAEGAAATACRGRRTTT